MNTVFDMQSTREWTKTICDNFFRSAFEFCICLEVILWCRNLTLPRMNLLCWLPWHRVFHGNKNWWQIQFCVSIFFQVIQLWRSNCIPGKDLGHKNFFGVGCTQNCVAQDFDHLGWGQTWKSEVLGEATPIAENCGTLHRILGLLCVRCARNAK